MEYIIILVIIVILFGVNKLPKLGKGLGEGIRNFKKGIKGELDENGNPIVKADADAVDLRRARRCRGDGGSPRVGAGLR